MKYDKLVRDKIPQIIADSGKRAVIRVLAKDECQYYLEKKLDEEVAEFHESKSIEELADILEVVYAIGREAGYSTAQINDMYRAKNKKQGGFGNRMVLMEVEDD